MPRGYDEAYELHDGRQRPNVRFTSESEFEDQSDSVTDTDSAVDPGFLYRHRTTSLHRNISARSQRNNSRSRAIDDRQDWIDAAATLGRQPLQEHVDHIVEKLEGDIELTANTQQAEQLRREALRDMPQSLTMKRMVKRKLLKQLSQKSKEHSIGCHQRIVYRLSMMMAEWSSKVRSFMYTVELWYTTLKTIEGEFGSAVGTFFRFYRWIFLLNVLTFVVCFSFVVVPQIMRMKNDDYDHKVAFRFGDVFTGNGYFGDTLMFYGFYNSTVSYGNVAYKMNYAYFFTMLCVIVINFVILSVSTATAYRRNFIETKGGLKNNFAHKIFAGWEFGIATPNAARLKSSAIYNELKELLNEYCSPTVKTTFWEKLRTFCLQCVTHLTVFGGLAAIGYGLWKLLDEYSNLVPAVVINVIMFVVPLCFTIVSRYEGYKNPRTAFNVTLLRTFLLKVLIIGVAVMYWVLRAEKKEHDEVCWETSLGQQIYRLITFDFFFSIVFLIATEVAHKLVSQKWKRFEAPEFDIARYALHVSYNQTLFWVGLYFAPLLSAIIIVKLVFTWYMVTLAVMKVCNPSRRSWRASHTHTWFLIMTFLSLILVMVTMGYVIASVSPSADCGPFRDLHEGIVYDILKKDVLVSVHGDFWKVLIYITKPGVISLILLTMCMLVYYLRAKALAQESMIDVLRNMLIKEAKDKEFLLQRISQITKGKWRYNVQETSLDPYKTSPSAYSIVAGRRRNYGDSSYLNTISSEALLPSTSNYSLPMDDPSEESVEDRYKKYE